MRVVHVINNATTCGGAERLTADLVELQRAAGYEVHVLASDMPGSGDWFADSTWPFASAKSLVRIRNRYWNPGARAALHALVTRWRPDIVHLHTIGRLSLASFPTLADVPTVLTVHGPELFVRGTVRFCLPAQYFRGQDRRRGELTIGGHAAQAAETLTAVLSRRVLRRYVDLFVAPSPFMAKLTEGSLGPTRVVRNGLREEYLAAARTRRQDPHGRGPRLVMAGRLEDFKGPQVLLAALPEILAAYPGAHLTIVGTGQMEVPLLRLAADLGVSGAVTLAGWQPPAVLATTFADADVAVVPPIWPESFGLTALEALASGCAVVASDLGGLSDLIHHDTTGLLVRPGDVAALAAAVNRLLADPALRSRLAAAGRSLADHLTMPAHAAVVLMAYEEAIQRYRQHRAAKGFRSTVEAGVR